MADYQIITDSCCDLTQELYQHYNVSCASLSVLYRGQVHQNFTEEAKVKEFYDGLRAGETATTSAVNPLGWRQVMEPALQEGKDVLCLAFSSALSTTYQSAVIAAEELAECYPQRKIHVVDTLAAALGQGLMVIKASQLRSAGMSLEDLTAWLEENKLHFAHWVTVDDLNHLKRGGRISAATAMVGGMLHVKPIIHVDDEGRLITVAKARGRRAAMEYLVDRLAEDITDTDTIAIAHGDCPGDAARLEQMIREKCPAVKNVITGYVGPVIGAHTGPGVLVAFFLGDHR